MTSKPSFGVPNEGSPYRDIEGCIGWTGFGDCTKGSTWVIETKVACMVSIWRDGSEYRVQNVVQDELKSSNATSLEN